MLKPMDIFTIQAGVLSVMAVDATQFENTYELIKSQIDGMITVARVGDLDIWVDDEGLLKELSPTILIKRSKANVITEKDTLLVGNAVLASHDEEGETIGLTDKAKEIVRNMKHAQLGQWPILVIEQF